ncbi:MAG: tetratricopeptide repeat protein, partial [Myxococcota bacterium]
MLETTAIRSLARAATAVCAVLAAGAAWLIAPAPAAAQIGDVALDSGPTAELYIRKRPSPPVSAPTTPELDTILAEREKERDAKRVEAIAMLRGFLDSKPTGEARAEALFKLAELLWEEARHQFVRDMNSYERRVEACRQSRKKCAERPKEPRVDLTEPTVYYREILDNHRDFRRTDLVLYLVGFATQEDKKYDESLGYFRQVIERFPQSPLFGDAWMMIGEHHFNRGQWGEARSAYANVLARPESVSFDLALFKTAWCDWKLGEIEVAARRFKEVLDLAVEAEKSGNARTRRRRASLRDEALEYLVIVFTEDRAISAQEVYDFLASIGGERYSKDVLVRVAKAYYNQSEYDRAVNTYRFLIDRDPTHLDAAAYQREIVQSYIDALDAENTIEQMAVLVDTFGPKSKWARANRRFPSRVKRSMRLVERQVRETATSYHAEAQQA